MLTRTSQSLPWSCKNKNTHVDVGLLDLKLTVTILIDTACVDFQCQRDYRLPASRNGRLPCCLNKFNPIVRKELSGICIDDWHMLKTFHEEDRTRVVVFHMGFVGLDVHMTLAGEKIRHPQLCKCWASVNIHCNKSEQVAGGASALIRDALHHSQCVKEADGYLL